MNDLETCLTFHLRFFPASSLPLSAYLQAEARVASPRKADSMTTPVKSRSREVAKSGYSSHASRKGSTENKRSQTSAHSRSGEKRPTDRPHRDGQGHYRHQGSSSRSGDAAKKAAGGERRGREGSRGRDAKPRAEKKTVDEVVVENKVGAVPSSAPAKEEAMVIEDAGKASAVKVRALRF